MNQLEESLPIHPDSAIFVRQVRRMELHTVEAVSFLISSTLYLISNQPSSGRHDNNRWWDSQVHIVSIMLIVSNSLFAKISTV